MNIRDVIHSEVTSGSPQTSQKRAKCQLGNDTRTNIVLECNPSCFVSSTKLSELLLRRETDEHSSHCNAIQNHTNSMALVTYTVQVAVGRRR